HLDILSTSHQQSQQHGHYLQQQNGEPKDIWHDKICALRCMALEVLLDLTDYHGRRACHDERGEAVQAIPQEVCAGGYAHWKGILQKLGLYHPVEERVVSVVAMINLTGAFACGCIDSTGKDQDAARDLLLAGEYNLLKQLDENTMWTAKRFADLFAESLRPLMVEMVREKEEKTHDVVPKIHLWMFLVIAINPLRALDSFKQRQSWFV
ncbi:MAG: hypothetical protein Q9174_006575, partial [Haloplaca sp. 1 TL-2023]